MKVPRFVQIQAIFNPETGQMLQNDKYPKIKKLIQNLSQPLAWTFIYKNETFFNKGGIPSWSRYNPVRMYNQESPTIIISTPSYLPVQLEDKILYILLMSNANDASVNMHLCQLPMTKKTVISTLMQTCLYQI